MAPIQRQDCLIGWLRIHGVRFGARTDTTPDNKVLEPEFDSVTKAEADEYERAMARWGAERKEQRASAARLVEDALTDRRAHYGNGLSLLTQEGQRNLLVTHILKGMVARAKISKTEIDPELLEMVIQEVQFMIGRFHT